MKILLEGVTAFLDNPASGQWAATAVALVGLILVVWQIRQLTEQQRDASKAATSQLYGLISEAMNRINSLFEDHPDWIPYFYSEKLVPADPVLKDALENVCEVYMDFVDAVVEQKGSLPDLTTMDWTTWDAYFRAVFASSQLLREFMWKNLEFYPDYLYAALGCVLVRSPWSGEIESRWRADEVDDANAERAQQALAPSELPSSGYPWIRTWMFREWQELVEPDSSSGSHLATQPPPPGLFAAVAATGPHSVRATLGWASPTTTPMPDARALYVLENWVVGGMLGTIVDEVEFVRAPSASALPALPPDRFRTQRRPGNPYVVHTHRRPGWWGEMRARRRDPDAAS